MNGNSDLVIEIIELPKDVRRFNLVAAFFHLRKQVFVDRMSWPLHHSEGIEFEQYDTFDTAYVIAHRDGEVVGGARLKRTDKMHGDGKIVYSYMIRDAHLGLLPGMPENLCSEAPPVEPESWELTRFTSLPIDGLAAGILECANDFLYISGATRCLFLGPPAFLRMANRLGWQPSPLGEVVGNADGRFLAFSCDVREPTTTTLN